MTDGNESPDGGRYEPVVAPTDELNVPPPRVDEAEPAFHRPIFVGLLALAIGLVVDALAFHSNPGVGIALALILVLVAVAMTSQLIGTDRPAGLMVVLGLGIGASLGLAVRTSPVLVALNILAFLVAFVVLSQMPMTRGSIRTWTVVGYIQQPIEFIGDMVVGGMSFLVTDVRSDGSVIRSDKTRGVVMGLLIGVPVALVFAALFASADARFEVLVENLIPSVDGVAERVIRAGIVAFVIVAIWRRAKWPVVTSFRIAAPIRIQATAGVTALVMIVAVFALFVLTQVIGDQPELIRDIDFARNAREGFFELVAVTALVVAVLLVFDWLTRTDDGTRSPAIDRLAIVLIVMTAIVMISALQRMQLYVDLRGLTELRFYTTVFMGWIGFLLVWFVRTVLKNQHARFAYGMLVSALGIVIALNLVNPDARISGVNAGRDAGAGLDERYLTGLSLDSIPALVAAADADPSTCILQAHLSDVKADFATDTIHPAEASWSLLRARSVLNGWTPSCAPDS